MNNYAITYHKAVQYLKSVLELTVPCWNYSYDIVVEAIQNLENINPYYDGRYYGASSNVYYTVPDALKYLTVLFRVVYKKQPYFIVHSTHSNDTTVSGIDYSKGINFLPAGCTLENFYPIFVNVYNYNDFYNEEMTEHEQAVCAYIAQHTEHAPENFHIKIKEDFCLVETNKKIDDFVKQCIQILPLIYKDIPEVKGEHTEIYKDIILDFCTNKHQTAAAKMTTLIQRYYSEDELFISKLMESTNRRITELENYITGNRADIEAYKRYINDKIKQNKEYTAIAESLKNEKYDDAPIKEAREYLKDIYPQYEFNCKICNEKPYYTLKGYTHINFWDEEQAVRNYKRYQDFKTENYLKLYKALFIDKTLKLRIYFSVGIDATNFNPRYIPPYYSEDKTYLPHPHLMRYDCWGTHADQLSEYYISNNLIGALTHLTYAVEQINVNDNCVIENVMEEAMSNDYCILEDATTGQIGTAEELIPDFINDYYEDEDYDCENEDYEEDDE